MAIKHSITLSTTEPNNEVGVIKIRQADEQTQTLEVQITENGVPMSFVGYQPFFCAKLGQTAGLGIVEQKITGTMNPANGTLEYVMRPEDWQKVGRQIGYFAFRKMKNDHEWTEQFTTRDFTYNVIPSITGEIREVKKDGSTYIWTIEDMLRLFKEYIATGKTDWEEFVEQNKEIIESLDPGGVVLDELIRTRKPEGAEVPYKDVPERLDKQIGLNNDFREFESGVSFLRRVKNEFLERGGNPKWYGAKFDGVTDDTQALRTCINNHQRIVLPPGTTIISDTLELTNKVMEGSQRQGTTIKMITRDKNKPAIKLGRHSSLSTMQIVFPSNNLSSLINDGEFVGVQLNTNTTLHRGIIKDIIIDGFGTGIHAPNSTFSCTFSDITIFNARHIYMHFSGGTRTGNIYSNIYLSEQGKNEFKSKAGIWFEGEESDGVMHQINIEHMQVERAAYFENCRAMDVSSFHIEGVEVYSENGAFMEFKNSNIRFGGLTAYYTRGHKAGQTFFLLSDSYPKEGLSGKISTITVDNLFFKGLNRPNDGIYSSADYPYDKRTLGGVGVQPWTFAKRSNGVITASDYVLKINNYDWYTWSNTFNDNQIYKKFDCVGNVIVDFNVINKYSKTASELVAITSPGAVGVKFKFVGAIGNSSNFENGSIQSPKRFDYARSFNLSINGSKKFFSQQLLANKSDGIVIRDELNLSDGNVVLKNELVKLSSVDSAKVEGGFIVVNLSTRPVKDHQSIYSKTTHFPKEEYRLDYSAFYVSINYLTLQGIVLNSDTNEIKITKFKNWLDAEALQGYPVTLVYERLLYQIDEITPENYFLTSNDLLLSVDNQYVLAKAEYNS